LLGLQCLVYFLCLICLLFLGLLGGCHVDKRRSPEG
jgi:hypothetical protein